MEAVKPLEESCDYEAAERYDAEQGNWGQGCGWNNGDGHGQDSMGSQDGNGASSYPPGLILYKRKYQ